MLISDKQIAVDTTISSDGDVLGQEPLNASLTEGSVLGQESLKDCIAEGDVLGQDPLKDYLNEWTDTQISSWDKVSFDTDVDESPDSGLASPTVNTEPTVDDGQSQAANRSALVVQNCAGWSAEASDTVVSAITQLGLNLTQLGANLAHLSDRLLVIETALTNQNVKLDNVAAIPGRMKAVEVGLVTLNRGHITLTKGFNKMCEAHRLDVPAFDSVMREVITALDR